MPELAKNAPKKPYSPPDLKVYGTVQQLTKRIGTVGNPDGGHGIGATKTHGGI
jgi:hypothetical protein